MFAFVDETGNTGANLLDERQPDFFTAALITKTNFDMVYADAIAKMAKKFGDGPLHGKDLGFGRCEEIAADLLKVFKKADARFFISRVEKKYLLASKIFDTFFDSGENAAASWHIYNIRPLRILLALKVASIVTEGIGQRFWSMLLDRNDARAKAALPGICQELIGRVGELPDQRSRDVVSETLAWARDNPDTIHIHLDSRQARNGHMPNMVAFANLLDGLEGFSKRWDRRVRRIRMTGKGRTRDLALFNIAIDSKLRSCDVIALKVDDVALARGQERKIIGRILLRLPQRIRYDVANDLEVISGA